MATMGVPWLCLLLWFDDAEAECHTEYLEPNSKVTQYAARPVVRCSASRMVSQAANPIVKAGMRNEMVNAN
jgi:hypothetical protein